MEYIKTKLNFYTLILPIPFSFRVLKLFFSILKCNVLLYLTLAIQKPCSPLLFAIKNMTVFTQ